MFPQFDPFGNDTHPLSILTGIKLSLGTGQCAVAVGVGFNDSHQLDIRFEKRTQGLYIVPQVGQMYLRYGRSV